MPLTWDIILRFNSPSHLASTFPHRLLMKNTEETFFLDSFQFFGLRLTGVACNKSMVLMSSGWLRVPPMWLANSMRCQGGWQRHLARTSERTVADLSAFRCRIKPPVCLFVSFLFVNLRSVSKQKKVREDCQTRVTLLTSRVPDKKKRPWIKGYVLIMISRSSHNIKWQKLTFF